MKRPVQIGDKVRYRFPMDMDPTRPGPEMCQGIGFVTNIFEDGAPIEIDSDARVFPNEVGILED